VQETAVLIHSPQKGFDEITLEAILCVIGAWGILLVIGA
jgi:hypothetical protein